MSHYNVFSFRFLENLKAKIQQKKIRYKEIRNSKVRTSRVFLTLGANNLPMYCKFIDIYVKDKLQHGALLNIDMERNIFAISYIEFIGQQIINELILHECLNCPIIYVYIKYFK